MTRGKDYDSLEQAKSEQLATAKKLISSFEMMMQTGEVFGFKFFRSLLLDFANANIRFMEAQHARIHELEAELIKSKGVN